MSEWIKKTHINPSLYPYNIPPRFEINQLWTSHSTYNYIPPEHFQEYGHEVLGSYQRRYVLGNNRSKNSRFNYPRGDFRGQNRQEMGEGNGYRNRMASAHLFSVFVDNLPHHMNRWWLKRIFSRYGEVKDSYIPFRNKRKGIYGFVRFSSIEEANKAIKWINGAVFLGEKIVARMAYDRPRGNKQREIFHEVKLRQDVVRQKVRKHWVPVKNQAGKLNENHQENVVDSSKRMENKEVLEGDMLNKHKLNIDIEGDDCVWLKSVRNGESHLGNIGVLSEYANDQDQLNPVRYGEINLDKMEDSSNSKVPETQCQLVVYGEHMPPANTIQEVRYSLQTEDDVIKDQREHTNSNFEIIQKLVCNEGVCGNLQKEGNHLENGRELATAGTQQRSSFHLEVDLTSYIINKEATHRKILSI